MRNNVCFNGDWLFLKGCGGPSAFIEDRAEPVVLPHTWNGEDGQYVRLFRRLRFSFGDAELAELGRKLNRIRRIRSHTEKE